MVLEVLIIIIAVVTIALIVNGVESYNKKDVMSFREAMDLTNLPIVTFYQGDKKFNFLLDTGASLSVINQAALNSVEHSILEGNGTLFGVDGVKREVSYASINLTYKNNNYSETFQVLDIQNAIDQIKAESGVNMIGILGSEFFRKYRYILDFNELIAYSKK
jgi:hypothetical protein